MPYAARFGWALPFILVCVWQVLRSVVFRELAILTLAAWCGVLFVSAQAYFGWYESLGLVGDASIVTLISISIAIICDQWRGIRDRKLRLPQEGLMKTEPMALATGVDSASFANSAYIGKAPPAAS